jgi:hypothetical protein
MTFIQMAIVFKDLQKLVSHSQQENTLAAPARPITPSGHKVEEVDAPEDYMNDLEAFVKKHSTK